MGHMYEPLWITVRESDGSSASESSRRFFGDFDGCFVFRFDMLSSSWDGVLEGTLMGELDEKENGR